MRLSAGDLTEAIAHLNPSALQSIAEYWAVEPDDAVDLPPGKRFRTSERMVATMASIWSAMVAIEKMDDAQRSAVLRVLNAGQLHHTELADLGDPDPLLRPLLEHLIFMLAFPWSFQRYGNRWGGKFPLSRDAYITVPNALNRSLRDALTLYTTPPNQITGLSLRGLIEQTGALEIVPNVGLGSLPAFFPPDGLPALVWSRLTSPEALKEILEKLPALPRRYFQAIQGGGPFPADDLKPELQPARVTSILSELGRRGLVFPVFLDGKRGCFIPTEIQNAIKGVKPPRPILDAKLEPAPSPPNEMSPGETLWWNMMVLGLWIESDRAELTSSTRQIPKRAVKELARAMAFPDKEQDDPDSLLHGVYRWLALGGERIKIEGLKLLPGDDWDNWKSWSLEQQMSAIATEWMNAIYYDSEVLPAGPGTVKPIALTLEMRRTVLSALAEVPVSEWITLHSFVSSIVRKKPYAWQDRQRLESLMGAAAEDFLFQNWTEFEARAITRTLLDFPLTSGIIDLGWTSREAPVLDSRSLRVTEAGARALTLLNPDNASKSRKAFGKSRGAAKATGASATGARSALIVQPNLEMILFEFDPASAYAVGQFAEPVAFDRVGTFRITARSVRLAAGRGVTAKQMKRTLARLSTAPIPQNVEYQIEEWAGSVRTISFQRGVLVETDGPDAMEALLLSRQLKNKVVRRLSPTMAMLPVGEDLEALSKLIEPLGFTWHKPKNWNVQEVEGFSTLSRTLRRLLSNAWR